MKSPNLNVFHSASVGPVIFPLEFVDASLNTPDTKGSFVVPLKFDRVGDAALFSM